MSPYRAMFNRVHRAGMPFVLAGFVVGVLCFLVGLETLGGLALLLTAAMIYFFRDPERVVSDRPGMLVSPADGLVALVDLASPPAELEMGSAARPRVSIFLSVLDVHVVRSPAEGQVGKHAYVPGSFRNAMDTEASEANERQLLRIDTPDGDSAGLAMIAGLIARRIVCDVSADDGVARGGRIGIIRFGSRVDIYCPEDMVPLVGEGQRMVGGETPIAERQEAARA